MGCGVAQLAALPVARPPLTPNTPPLQAELAAREAELKDALVAERESGEALKAAKLLERVASRELGQANADKAVAEAAWKVSLQSIEQSDAQAKAKAAVVEAEAAAAAKAAAEAEAAADKEERNVAAAAKDRDAMLLGLQATRAERAAKNKELAEADEAATLAEEGRTRLEVSGGGWGCAPRARLHAPACPHLRDPRATPPAPPPPPGPPQRAGL